jgi:hypothetical protein
MRKIQASDVHALEDHTPENLSGLAGGADGTDNFGFAHGFSFLTLLENYRLWGIIVKNKFV